MPAGRHVSMAAVARAALMLTVTAAFLLAAMTQGSSSMSPSVADFTAFERIFPAWCGRFKSGTAVGEYDYLLAPHKNSVSIPSVLSGSCLIERRVGRSRYSYFPGHPTSVYGSADMLMSMFVLGRLGNLTEAEKDSWATTINRFQDAATGLFLAQSFEPHFGPAVLHAHDHEHTTAFALAALTLIGRSPAHPLTLMLNLQANHSRWQPWLANAALACTFSVQCARKNSMKTSMHPCRMCSPSRYRSTRKAAAVPELGPPIGGHHCLARDGKAADARVQVLRVQLAGRKRRQQDGLCVCRRHSVPWDSANWLDDLLCSHQLAVCLRAAAVASC